MSDETRPGEVTQILRAAEQGRPVDMNALMPLVYNELRALAARQMASERPDHTLQPTALVNEAFFRLAPRERLGWASKKHFFAAAAAAMRKVLIDHARRKGRQKRGGSRRRVPMNAWDMVFHIDIEEILAVDEAICRLEKRDSKIAEVVKLRVFVGSSDNDIAQILGISERTVRREWVLAKAWLRRALSKE